MCKHCNGTGMVLIEKKAGSHNQEFGYRCVCEKGQNNKRYKGFPTIPQKYLQDWYGKDQVLMDFAAEVIENAQDPFQEVSNHG